MLKVIPVNGQQHVVREGKRHNSVRVINGRQISQKTPQPNYRGSGYALVGILKPGQTLEQFLN